MKTITMVIGSMRKGNSAYIAGEIQKSLPKISVYTLGHNIAYCTGCLECDETHRCIIRDDMDEIISSILGSEILLIVTPVRYSLMSGDVKVFIDRLNPTAVAETLFGKKVMAIAIGQTEEADGAVQDAIKSIEIFAQNAGMDFLGGYPVFTCYGEHDLSEKTEVVSNIIKWVQEKIK